jgi:hypothetical protein
MQGRRKVPQQRVQAIAKDHDDIISTTPRPSSKEFSLITAKVSGLFIFAQVLIRRSLKPNSAAKMCLGCNLSKSWKMWYRSDRFDGLEPIIGVNFARWQVQFFEFMLYVYYTY